VIERNLTTDPVPHLTAERFAAFLAIPAKRTAEQRAHVAYSDMLIEELRTADDIVLGLPMYNFGIPSSLKAYIDHIARSGHTFRYTAEGPIGLLNGKRVFVAAARGGTYTGTLKDTQTQYVRNLFGFLGLTDVTFVYAEGLALGESQMHDALEGARDAVQKLTL
jgi:FMN-dependent NADH-azoreductase